MPARAQRFLIAVLGVAAGATYLAVSEGAKSPAVPSAHAAVASKGPTRHITARRMRPRPHATPRGTVMKSGALFGPRVFANDTVGFALANSNNAQYPVRSLDRGLTWRIDGPQFHVDAADAPEGVGLVGMASRRTYFAYGSSVVDVTTNGGRRWWEAFLGELVVAVVPGSGHRLVAYVQNEVNSNFKHVPTIQYVTKDGGRHWNYSTTLGGLPG